MYCCEDGGGRDVAITVVGACGVDNIRLVAIGVDILVDMREGETLWD